MVIDRRKLATAVAGAVAAPPSEANPVAAPPLAAVVAWLVGGVREQAKTTHRLANGGDTGLLPPQLANYYYPLKEHLEHFAS